MTQPHPYFCNSSRIQEEAWTLLSKRSLELWKLIAGQGFP